MMWDVFDIIVKQVQTLHLFKGYATWRKKSVSRLISPASSFESENNTTADDNCKSSFTLSL